MTVEERVLQLIPENIPATIGDLPSTRANSVSIMMYDGNFNTEYFGGRQGSTLYQPIVKLVIRHESYEQAKGWVDAVKEALHRYTDDTFKSILLVGSPLYLGKSALKLHEFQLTFNLTIQ